MIIAHLTEYTFTRFEYIPDFSDTNHTPGGGQIPVLTTVETLLASLIQTIVGEINVIHVCWTDGFWQKSKVIMVYRGDTELIDNYDLEVKDECPSIVI